MRAIGIGPVAGGHRIVAIRNGQIAERDRRSPIGVGGIAHGDGVGAVGNGVAPDGCRIIAIGGGDGSNRRG